MIRRMLIPIIAFATFSLLAVLVPDAEAAACSNKVRSKKSDQPVTVKFINKSGEYRRVMWVDFEGKWVTYANLKPGQSYTVNTFTSHPWVFAEKSGKCAEMFLPKRGVSRFNITAK